MAASSVQGFPRTFYIANAIELFERLAFYGMFVGVSLYLGSVVGMSDIAVGNTLSFYRLVASLAPVPCGALADRMGFRKSLCIAFGLYLFAYLSLYAFPRQELAVASLAMVGVAGGFMKPVITGTVVRTAPPDREADGFAIFYRMVNSGSVVGKTFARQVRARWGLPFVMLNSVVASAVALALAVFAYREPERGRGKATPFGQTLRGYAEALKDKRFSLFLVIFAGFYFMADQFYFTFPQYVTRHIDKNAPLEYVTLVNPATIALFQSRVTARTENLRPITCMILGVGIASLAMVVMGITPGLLGACLSGVVFAFAEMTFAPRFYAFVSSFAPEGKAGMYMGLAFVPAALGGVLGGQVSGPMVARYLPADGPRNPLVVWLTYAALGLVTALLMGIYARTLGKAAESTELSKPSA